eukprot:4750812-Heterocapsa_arctica.AAC.1
MVQKFVYLDDVAMPVDQANRAYASTFEFYLEYVTEHIAKVFDKLMMRLNTSRSDKDYTILHDINRVTKTNLIQSILGLGH